MPNTRKLEAPVLLLAIAVAAACNASPPAAATADSAATEGAPPGSPSTAASAGAAAAASAAPGGGVAPVTGACAGKTGAAGDTAMQVVSGGLARASTAYVPKGYDGTRALPIVLVLHPLTANAMVTRHIVHVEPHADDPEHGFIALFPDGIDMSWNAGECCSMDPKPDDVGFMRDLVAQASATWCVDTTRLYAMGYSNGAALAHRLACELPGGLTAFTAVAGTLGREVRATCAPPHPTPVLAIHGTADEVVPYAAASTLMPLVGHVTFPPALDADAFWATADGCGPASPPYFTKGDVSCARHEGCRDGVTVGMCTVTGGGHQWPGGPWFPGLGASTDNLDATAAAVELFRGHGL